MKKAALEVGQTVWIETRNYNFSAGGFSRKLHQGQIVEANRSSAYAVLVDDLQNEKAYRHRIDQKTKKIVDSGVLFGHYNILWLSQEAYEDDVQLEADMQSFSHQIIEAVKNCKDLEKLKKALGILI